MLAEEIINNITIKASSAPKIIDISVFKLCPEGNCEPLYFCDKYLITFRTR